jgi:dissimilatory sulfite reductase (desulfoviridin) alpha/beta subunit
VEKVIEGARINIQRSIKKMTAPYSPDEAVVSITVPVKKVTKELLDNLMELADQSLKTEMIKWGKEGDFAINTIPPEKVKEVEEYVNKMLDGD